MLYPVFEAKKAEDGKTTLYCIGESKFRNEALIETTEGKDKE